MNRYLDIVRETVDHIESRLGGDLSLARLARRANLSEFHFNRIFRAVTGTTPKQYVLGRRLASAADRLGASRQSILDIAFSLGFASPEVFTRAFRKHFGSLPSACRKTGVFPEGLPRARVVERDIASHRGGLALQGECQGLPGWRLAGIRTEVRTRSPGFRPSIQARNAAFIERSRGQARFVPGNFYTVVRCLDGADDRYLIWCGRRLAEEQEALLPGCLDIPAGWYASFRYRGDMFAIGDRLLDDIYGWIVATGAVLRAGDIGMLNVYSDNYPADDRVRILVPLERPL
jgi:AraC family transcriptional regulator